MVKLVERQRFDLVASGSNRTWSWFCAVPLLQAYYLHSIKYDDKKLNGLIKN